LASTSSSHKTHLNCYAEDDCDATASSNNVTDSPPYFPSYEDCRVLILGCGNSTFAEDMRDDGWCGPIVNIDFSTVVIDQMKKRYEERGYNDASDTGESAPKTSFVCADITEGFPFEAESFDLVIMKGTLDAILCSNGGSFSAKDVVTECARVLSTGYGCLFLVSHSNPDGRVEFLEYENNISHYWQSVSIHNLPRHGVHIGSKYVPFCEVSKRNE
jgi:SAM-dependent methyltransferase